VAEGGEDMTRKVTGTVYVVLVIVVLALIAIPWVVNLIAELVPR
jgi:hypothetical protein